MPSHPIITSMTEMATNDRKSREDRPRNGISDSRSHDSEPTIVFLTDSAEALRRPLGDRAICLKVCRLPSQSITSLEYSEYIPPSCLYAAWLGSQRYRP